MKKLALHLCLLIGALEYSCSPADSPKTPQKDINSTRSFPTMARDMTIYEVNIRQFTPEGTFTAFTEHLPRLKKLGVDILWIMPVQPIGVKNRKGTLGSYYSIMDYKDVNPEFGSMDDFEEMVDKAHDEGMYVILDWVPNHTAWDHTWISEHPEYYMTDSAARELSARLGVGEDYYKQSGTGNLVYEADWSDIALLNLYHEGTREAMIDAMEFWITETDIDGFRADHAGHEIPMFFWEEAIEILDPLKDLFWLAEWDEPRMHLTFHATYDWKLLHLTEEVARGEKNAEDLHDHILKDLALYGQGAYRLNMITNHDENAWAGTIEERYGEGEKAMAVFSFTAYGIPMIYSGQEAGMSKRLEFFEKDTISWEDPKNYSSFYQKLNQLREDNPALWSGEHGGMPTKVEDGNKEVFTFYRSNGENHVLGIINMSGEQQQIKIDNFSSVSMKEVFTGTSYKSGMHQLDPWQYLIFSSN